MNSLIEYQIRSVNWKEYHCIRGEASDVPDALVALMEAKTSEEVDDAYWRLENIVVVSGQLYTACIPVVDVILSALAANEISPNSKASFLELLFQIINGVTDEDEQKLGIQGIEIECLKRAQRGLWLFYRDRSTADAEAIGEILSLIDDDTNRLETVL